MFSTIWFKFYGQDWLTDPKVIALSHTDRLCLITLFCLASASQYDDARITGLTDESLLALTHIYPDPCDDEVWNNALGVIKRLIDNGMITHDNGMITLTNFLKRQNKNLTGYERVKKYRKKKKEMMSTEAKKKNSVIIDNTNDNTMITPEESRVEESRVDINNTVEAKASTPSIKIGKDEYKIDDL